MVAIPSRRGQTAALFLLLIFAAVPVSAEGFTTDDFGNVVYFEDFETLPTTFAPERENIYTTSGAGGTTTCANKVTGLHSFSGNKSWQVSTNSEGCAAKLHSAGADLCQGYVDFRFKTTTNTGYQAWVMLTSQSTGLSNSAQRAPVGLGFEIAGTVIKPQASGAGNSLYIGGGSMTLTADTWYHLRLTPNCAAGQISITNLATEQTISGDASFSISGLTGVGAGCRGTFQSGTDCNNIVHFDDIQAAFVESAPPPPPAETIPALDSLSISGIEAANADTSLSALAVRADGGLSVKSVNPATMTVIGSTSLDNNCADTDLQDVFENVLAFADCDAGGAVASVKLVSASDMLPLPHESTCTGECDQIYSGVPSDLDYLALGAGTTFQNGDQFATIYYGKWSNNDACTANLAVDLSSGADTVSESCVSHGGGTVQHSCTTQTRHYQAVMVGGGQAKRYELFTHSPSYPFAPTGTQPTVATDYGFGGSARAACGGISVALQIASTWVVVAYDNPADSASLATNAAFLALSQDGKWAYDSLGQVWDVAAQVVVANTDVRTGTIIDVFIDATGQYAWMVTTDGISRYEIYPATTETPVSSGAGDGTTGGGGGTGQAPGSGGSGGATTGGNAEIGAETGGDYVAAPNEGGFLDNTADMLVDSWGLSGAGAKALIALLVIGVIAAGLGASLGIFGAVIGTILGTVASLFLGLLPVWVMLLLVMLCAAFIARTMFGSRGQDPGE